MSTTRDELARKFPSQKVCARTCNVADESQTNDLVAFALRELGSLHVLVLNAGVYGPMGATESVSLDEWRQAMDINVYGVLLPSRAVISHFKQNGRGKIIVLSGGGATNPLPNISAYAASKAAAVRLMETLAEELKAFHVDVNAIAPGALATRLVDEVLAAGPEKVGAAFYEKNKQWKEKGATPLEFGAKLAVYLASSRTATGFPASLSARNGILGKNFISSRRSEQRHLHVAPHRAEGSRQNVGRQMNYAIVGCGLIERSDWPGCPPAHARDRV